MKITYILIILFALVVAGGGVYLFRPAPDYETNIYPSPEAEDMEDEVLNGNFEDIEPLNQVVRVTLKTSMGDVVLALDGTRAPKTVSNFVKLAEDDFYDGTSFHRVITDFMIQGGDPLSKDQDQRSAHGTGGPGYAFEDEINAESYGFHEAKLIDALEPSQAEQLTQEAKDLTIKQFYEVQGYRYATDYESLPMRRSVVAMANSGPNTNGSQFFIITAESVAHLEGKHTPFGVVESGMEVVDLISQVEVDSEDNPIEPVTILDIEVDKGTAGALKTIQ